jgi:hypothetical protein
MSLWYAISQQPAIFARFLGGDVIYFAVAVATDVPTPICLNI